MSTETLLELLTVPIPETRNTAVDPEGWVYDVDTGEVIGKDMVDDRFKVDTPEAADWALEVRSRIEGNILAIDERKRAVCRQLDAMRNDQIRRLSWWEWRFGSDLIGFARTLLKGKSRSVKFTWGSVSFRTTQGTTEILDMPAAVAFVRAWEPELVKVVETVGLKAIEAARRQAVDATGEDESLPFVRSTGQQESVSISTGIEATGKERK